jgi:hypothetical protein
MLRKRKEPKHKSIALTLMRDVQGSAAEKLRMFEKVRALADSRKKIRPSLARRKRCCGRLRRWRSRVAEFSFRSSGEVLSQMLQLHETGAAQMFYPRAGMSEHP